MMNDIFGTERFFDSDWYKLLSRLGLDIAITSLIVIWVYYRMYKNRDFVFTYYIFNIITFSMCVLLRKVPMELGFALGLILLNPEFLKPYDSVTGQLVLLVIGGLLTVAFTWLRRMARLEEPERFLAPSQSVNGGLEVST